MPNEIRTRGDSPLDTGRRRILRAGLGATAMFLPVPYAWVWAQSEGTLKLLRAPKIALVIGNSNYKRSPLKNPANDARAIADTLRNTGFDVTLKVDAGHSELVQAVQSYTDLLTQRKGVGLFYFAGHGLQLAWRNYMVPVDADIRSATDIQKQGVEVGTLLSGISKAVNPLNVIILDACRDNPFDSLVGLDQKGLSQMDAPPSTLLAYATAPGNVASDGEGANGLYTEHLLKEIIAPDAKVEDVFTRVRLHVRRRANGLQIPWESTSLEEDFYFLPPKTLSMLAQAEAERERKQEEARREAQRVAEEAERKRQQELAELEKQRLVEEAERKRKQEQALKYSIGKRWSARYQRKAVDWPARDVSMDFKVVTKEQIVVPAGTFDAFKIVGSGQTQSNSERANVNLQYHYWIAPEVRRHVAMESFSRNSWSEILENERMELISYT